jgi:hypothetical protein
MMCAGVVGLSSGSLDLDGSLHCGRRQFRGLAAIPAAAQSAPLHQSLLNFVPFYSTGTGCGLD